MRVDEGEMRGFQPLVIYAAGFDNHNLRSPEMRPPATPESQISLRDLFPPSLKHFRLRRRANTVIVYPACPQPKTISRLPSIAASSDG